MTTKTHAVRSRRPARQDEAPPHNIECEERILACMLRENGAVEEVAGILRWDDFYRDSHQIACREMFAVNAAGRHFDGVTFGDHLESKGLLEKLGGRQWLSHLGEGVMFHAIEVEYYAQIVGAHALRRRIIELGIEASAASYAQDETPQDVIAGLEARLSDALLRYTRPKDFEVAEIADEVREAIIACNSGLIVGVPTGFPDLDRQITSLEPSRLYVIAGRPGMGKTAFALNVIENVARHQAEYCEGKSIYVVSLEMTARELAKRLIASIARLPGERVKNHSGEIFSDREMAQLDAATAEAKRLKIRIDDASGKTISQVRSQARLAKRKHDAGLIVVDHLGLIESDGGNRSETRQQHIGKVTRMLKNLARDLGVPVIALSQLNRNNTDRTEKRPTLSDLRESGDIEQDADTVMLLHRPDYYDAGDKPGEAELLIAKQRDGSTGPVKLRFIHGLTRFVSYNDPEFYAGREWHQR